MPKNQPRNTSQILTDPAALASISQAEMIRSCSRSFFQNCSSGRESALISEPFEPTHVRCYGVLKLPHGFELLTRQVTHNLNLSGRSGPAGQNTTQPNIYGFEQL